MTILVVEDESLVLAAIRTGLLPRALLGAPARIGRDEARLFVRLSAELEAGALRTLEENGFSTRARWPGRLPAAELASLAEAIPLVRGPEPEPPFASIVFHRPKEGFLGLVEQLLRLGCDEMELRFFVDDAGDAHCLIRAERPPYYVVLSALDPSSPTVAYRSVDARGAVFAPLGWDHPLADDLAAPSGALLLARPGAPWLRVPEGPWAPLERHLDIVPPTRTRWTETTATERLRVELRLARSSRAEDADLWILRRRAAAQLDGLLTTLPDPVLATLAFAPLETEGGRIIAIRARRRAGRPPALPLADAEAYASLPQVESLHLPPGTTITPPLRVSKLRQLLAPDPEQLVWTVPLEGGAFRVERAAEAAFRPLREWVDHVAAEDAGVLEAWVARASFLELEPFVALDAEWATEPSAKAPTAARRSVRRADAPPHEAAPTAPEARAPDPTPFLSVDLALDAGPLVPGDAAIAIEAAERRFCELDAPADDPARVALWIELARRYGAAERRDAAALAWTNALWEAPAADRPAIARAWADASGPPPEGARPPSRDEVRTAAAHLVARAYENAPLAALEPLRHLLDAHDAELDCRTLWLVRERMFERSGDPLARVQAQDAVLSRLRGGLPADEVPSFVRVWGGDGTAEGAAALLTAALDRMAEHYRDTVRQRSAVEAEPELTDGYVEFLFAWGYARLGRRERADRALELADALHRAAEIDPKDRVHGFLRRAFSARVRQAIEGLPIESPLPLALSAELDALERIERYKVDRLRDASSILDWTHNLDPFVAYRSAPASSLYAALDDPSPAGIARAAEARLTGASSDASTDASAGDALMSVLALLRVLPEHLAVPALHRLLARVSAIDEAERAPVLEDAMLVATRCESADAILETLDAFRALASSTPDIAVGAGLALGRLGGCLHRAGRAHAAAAIVEAVMAQLDDERPETIVARLELATGLARMGRDDHVEACIAAALAIPDHALTPRLRLGLVREVALTLGHTSPARAVGGVASLLERLPTITDSFNTNSHFCLSVLHFMESMVSGLASRDLSLTPFAVRFIEMDEHRIRRRIFANEGDDSAAR